MKCFDLKHIIFWCLNNWCFYFNVLGFLELLIPSRIIYLLMRITLIDSHLNYAKKMKSIGQCFAFFYRKFVWKNVASNFSFALQKVVHHEPCFQWKVYLALFNIQNTNLLLLLKKVKYLKKMNEKLNNKYLELNRYSIRLRKIYINSLILLRGNSQTKLKLLWNKRLYTMQVCYSNKIGYIEKCVCKTTTSFHQWKPLNTHGCKQYNKFRPISQNKR